MKSKIYLIVIIILIIFTSNIYSQYTNSNINSNNNSNIRDSLLNIINFDNNEDTNRVNNLCKLAKTYRNENQLDGIQFCLQGIELAKKIDFKIGLINIYEEIGVLYKQIKDFNKSEEYFLNALDLIKENSDKFRLAKIYNTLGKLYYSQNNFTKALDNYFFSLNLFSDLDDKINKAGSLGNIGMVYWGLMDYQSALDYFKQALELSNTTGDKANMVFCLGNIAAVYSVMNQNNKALETYLEALKLDEELDDKEGQSTDLGNIATIYIDRGELEKGLFFTNKSYEINKGINNKFGMMFNYNCFGNLYYSLATDSIHKKYSISNKEEYLQKSLDNYLKAISIGQEFNAFKELVEIYMSLSDVYKTMKNWERAYYFQGLSSKLKDSVYTEETRNKILKLEMKQVTELKDKEIHILSQEKDYSNLRFYFLLASLILVLIIIIIIFIFYRKTKKDNKLLKQQNLIISEKEKLVNKIIANKDKFFSIIAHDLKNPIGAFRNLTEMLYQNIESFDEIELKEALSDIKDSSKIVYDLLENLLIWSRSQRGLISFEPMDVNINFIINNCFKLLKPDSDNKNILMESQLTENIKVNCDSNMISTIFRNLIANSIKFSNPDSKILVKSEDKIDEIIFYVIDNGIGMTEDTLAKLFRIDVNISILGTSSEKGTGLGLILCKEFVEKHGGRIWAESIIDQGTTFIFTIPKSLKNN